MRKTRDLQVEKSSGNVFADIGIPSPDEALAKAKIMLLIRDVIEGEGMTQVAAAEKAGVAQSDISNIARGRGRTYSLDRLFSIFYRLGGRIAIEARVGGRKQRISIYA